VHANLGRARWFSGGSSSLLGTAAVTGVECGQRHAHAGFGLRLLALPAVNVQAAPTWHWAAMKWWAH
jgi:hypothetical protein